MITDCIKLRTTGLVIKLERVIGIYRDNNPAYKGKAVNHWIKFRGDDRVEKILFSGLTHEECMLIRSAAYYNQMRDSYSRLEKVTIEEDSK